MNYLVITGDHPRHLYYLNSIADYCNLVGAVIEKRESFVPAPPDDLNKKDHDNYLKHFRNREKYELEYFGEKKKLPACPISYFEDSKLSEDKVINFIKQKKVDIVFIFGVLDFTRRIKDRISDNIILINLNTGLIQRYNGDATLFWPFYFLEPNWVGATFHVLDNNLDTNNIIHQSVPLLKKGDTIHKVASKVLLQATKDAKIIIDYLENNNSALPIVKKDSGKIFFSNEFRPEHLRVIYNLFDDNLVDFYLNNEIFPTEPNLIRLNNE